MHHMWSADRLEKKAVDILTNYKSGELLTVPQAMDVDHFAELQLNVSIDFAYLSQDKQTLGCTCFSDGKLIVWNAERTVKSALSVEKGWIFVDKDVLDYDVEGRIRFTIIHECAHWILHKRFNFKKPGEVIPHVRCKVFQIENCDRKLPRTDEEIREWQANRLGAALIMPACTVRMLLASKLKKEIESLSPAYYSEILIQEMADIYQVSRSAMRTRLKELNLMLS